MRFIIIITVECLPGILDWSTGALVMENNSSIIEFSIDKWSMLKRLFVVVVVVVLFFLFFFNSVRLTRSVMFKDAINK